MPQRDIDPNQLGEDWEGNNVALTRPLCGKVFIVSGLLDRVAGDPKVAQRDCPKCKRSTGIIKGGRKRGGTAVIRWSE